MRNLRRDTSGNVIGGIKPVDTGSGSVMMPFGTARQAGPALSATPRLDAGVSTPRMDSNSGNPIRYNTAASRTAEMQSAAQKSAVAGGFGIGAQERAVNLQGRQSLFARMKAVGASGVSPEMKDEAIKLGVKPSGWRSAVGKLSAAPAMVAAPGARPATSPAVPAAIAKPAGAPAAPVALSGADKANADMAKFGVKGAVERALSKPWRATARYRAE